MGGWGWMNEVGEATRMRWVGLDGYWRDEVGGAGW